MWRRRGSGLVWLLAAAAAVVGWGALGAGSGGSAAAAASDEAPRLYLSPNGSDAGPCTKAAPCRTLARGYVGARRGDVVELAAGVYPGEEFGGAAKGTSGAIVFRPAPGAAVRIDGELRLRRADHVEFRSLQIGDYYVLYSSDVTFRDVATKFFFIRSSQRVNLLGGSVGGVQTGIPATIGNYDAGDPPATDVVIDGVTFHDIGRSLNPESHIECLFVQETVRLTIRNSRFTRCAVMDLYVNDISGGPVPQGLTIENNWFDAPIDGGFYAINVRWDPGDVVRDHVIRYNSINGSILFSEGGTYENVQVYGNVGRISDCNTPGIAYAYNVWSNLRCGATDRRGSPGFVDAGAFDLHLSSGSPAIGAGDPARVPRRDIEGDSRPTRMRPDAGADQREPASLVLGRSIGRIALGDTEASIVKRYGSPRRNARSRVAGRRLRKAVYVTRGGTLWAVYDANRLVVEVGTRSRYYGDARGVGVGTARATLGRLQWDACRRVSRRTVRGAVVLAAIRGTRVTSLSFTRPRYAECRR